MTLLAECNSPPALISTLFSTPFPLCRHVASSRRKFPGNFSCLQPFLPPAPLILIPPQPLMLPNLCRPLHSHHERKLYASLHHRQPRLQKRSGSHETHRRQSQKRPGFRPQAAGLQPHVHQGRQAQEAVSLMQPPQIIFGYHGCDQNVLRMVLDGGQLQPSLLSILRMT